MLSSLKSHSGDIQHPHESEKDSVDNVVVLQETVTTYPEGGLRAWSVVLGVWLLQFATLGYTNAHGAYNDFYVREYLIRYSSSQIGWIGSVQLLFVVSSGIFTGRAFDIGYFYHLMFGGSALFILCLFMLSLTQPQQYYQVFLAQGLGLGIASGITYVPGLAVLSHYFQRRRALAMGIATTGSAVGATFHPILLNHLFHGRTGYHNGVRASAALNLGAIVVALLLMRPRLPPSSRKQGSTWRDLQIFLREPAYVATILGIFLILAGIYFPIFFLQLKTIENGLSPGFAFYTLVILNATNGVGRVLPNIFARPLGVFNLMIFCMASLGVLVFCMLPVKDIPGTVVFAVLFGFFSGTYAGLLTPMIASLAKTDAEIGARIGLCFAFTGFGGLIGTPIAGALLTSAFIWWRPLVFSGVCMLSGTGFLCFARYDLAKEKGTGWL